MQYKLGIVFFYCLCLVHGLTLAYPAVDASAALKQPISYQKLGYPFVPQMLEYPKELPVTPEKITTWYQNKKKAPSIQKDQIPADGKRILSVFVLNNPTPNLCQLILPLPSLKTRLKFGMIVSNQQHRTHFYNEIASWKVQDYRSLIFRPEEGKVLLAIPPHQEITVFIICNVAKKHEYVLYSAKGYQQLTATPALNYLMFYVALLSFMCVSILFGFLQFLQQRDYAYFYYALYMSLMSFLIFRRLEKINPYLDLGLYVEGASWWWEHARAPIYILSFVAYQMFVLFMFKGRITWPWFRNFIYYANLALVVIAPLQYVTKYYWERLDFMQAILAPLSIFWLWVFYQLYRQKLDTMIKWILAGSLIAVLGALSGNFIGTRIGHESPLTFLHYGDMPLHLAIVLDALCLTVALSFRHHAILRERNDAQFLALKTAKENARLAKKMSEQKQEELLQRKTELQLQSKNLINLRLEALETQKQQALAETELLALREQLKPHFVANCINSIRNLIANEKAADASLYLSKLGILLTQIFELTEKSAISLREELELLKLYLDLEKLRFRERFKVIFDIDPSLPLDTFTLPPLLLQPFAENAIKHAFKDNTPGQELKISATSLNHGVVLSIEDNGIGRLATAKNNEITQQGSGVGIGLCADRLQLFNERFNFVSTINIVDLEYQGSPSGTRVELHFLTPKI